MLAIEILRFFNAHAELATYYCECNFTPRGLAVQYLNLDFLK